MSSTSFSNLRGLNLLNVLTEIENLEIDYREDLTYDPLITYGIEIEYENVSRKFVNKFIKDRFKNWDSKDDGSLDSGGEIASPILNQSKDEWIQLKEICNYLKNNKANMLDNASCHIHVGRQVFITLSELRKFIKMYILFEPLLFRFGYGDKISARKKIAKYSKSVRYDLYKLLTKIEECSDLYEAYSVLSKLSRYGALNFTNINSKTDKKTIEFRLFNASSNHIILQNNINTVSNMALTPHIRDVDENYLNYEIKKAFEIDDGFSFWYNEVNISLALIFVDYIFDNDIDKLYFLKQYIKGFESNYGLSSARYAKKITK